MSESSEIAAGLGAPTGLATKLHYLTPRRISAIASVVPGVTSLAYCQEAKRLLEEFATSVKELSQLHQAHFDAIFTADPHSDRFEDLIHVANEVKHKAKYAYLAHLDTHCCSRSD